MENANKAFMMAASMLVAIMLLTLFVTFIRRASVWPETQDEIKSAEQLATFNAEYEVYQKLAMYGVDVISCLNKAKSNNEKYVEGGSFSIDGAYGKNYLIDVTVKINTPLTESIEVTAIQVANGSYRDGAVLGESDRIVKNDDNENIKLGNIFNINAQLTKFSADAELRYTMEETIDDFEVDKVYSLVDSSVLYEYNVLELLLKHSNEPKQIKKNNGKNKEYNLTQNGWTTATWTTCLYNFKKKRFKCDNLEYSEKTGRVNKIDFIEI